MKIAIDELTGSSLAFAVALANKLSVAPMEGHDNSLCVGSKGVCIGVLTGLPIMEVLKYGYYEPETDQRISGAIIDTYKIATYPVGERWIASTGEDGHIVEAQSRSLAAMRCFIKQHYPYEIDADGCIEVPAKLGHKKPVLSVVNTATNPSPKM